MGGAIDKRRDIVNDPLPGADSQKFIFSTDGH